MENLFERIVDLLGKTPDHADSRQFVKELGEAPPFERLYFFKRSGFSLFPEKHVFTDVFFHLNGTIDEPSYSGNLPGDITAGDDIDAVHKKLAPYLRKSHLRIDSRTGREESHREEYDLPECFLQVHFDANHKLSRVSATKVARLSNET